MDILAGHLRKVRGYLNLGKPRRALFILEEIPTHHRTDDRYERMQFEVFMAMERWDKALEVANELNLEFREDAEAKIFRAWSLLELGQIESALDTLDQIPNEGLDDARYHYVLARLMMRFGHDQMARESLDRAIDLDPDMAKIAAGLPGTARLMGMR